MKKTQVEYYYKLFDNANNCFLSRHLKPKKTGGDVWNTITSLRVSLKRYVEKTHKSLPPAWEVIEYTLVPTSMSGMANVVEATHGHYKKARLDALVQSQDEDDTIKT